MGNLVGVVAAVSVGGAGAVFWMWVTALLGASTSFVESTLAQKYKEPDPLYGGWRGGPAFYLHKLAERKRGSCSKNLLWLVVCSVRTHLLVRHQPGYQQLGERGVFQCVFPFRPLVTTLALTALAAVIVLRKDATVKSLDVIVPIMAGCYFLMTLYVVFTNLPQLPGVLARIFSEAFGLRQAAAGGLEPWL